MAGELAGKSHDVPVYERRRFDGSRAAIGEARDFLRAAMQGRARPEVEEELVLALSELTTNAVLHAGTPFEVIVETNDQARIEVEDGSTQAPELRPAYADAVTGRGLRIVDQLCDRWGVHVARDRKCVWCERDLA
jgi:anti-sigma regulatory factor (Ser/Thr protein kinase)